MPSKAAEAPAPYSRGSAGAMLVILTLAAVLLSAPLVRAASFPVSGEQVLVGTTDGTAGVQAEDGLRETMREADVAPDPLAYPSIENLSKGSQVAGVFPADVQSSDGVYVQYREATSPPVVVQSNPAVTDPGCTWTACANGMASDDAYASSSAGGDAGVFRSFSFGIPAAAAITRVEVGYEAFDATGNDHLTITISWDGGVSWCPARTTGSLPGTDPGAYSFLDFTTCTGHAWTPSDFGTAIATSITHSPQGPPETIDLDANVVRVTYQPLVYELALQYDWTGVASGQRYDLRVKGHVSDENVSVQVLTPPSVWTPRLTFTDTADQVLTYSLAASEFNAGNVSIRFVDALGPDLAPSDLSIDYVDVLTTVLAYRLDVSQTVTGVGGADPTLDVEGNISAGGENFDVFAWNFTASAWGLKMASVFTAVNEKHRVALLPDEIFNGTVRIDFQDRDPASTVPATLTLDLVQVSTTDPTSGLSSILLGGGVIAGIAAAAAFVFFVVLPRRKTSADDAEAAAEPRGCAAYVQAAAHEDRRAGREPGLGERVGPHGLLGRHGDGHGRFPPDEPRRGRAHRLPERTGRGQRFPVRPAVPPRSRRTGVRGAADPPGLDAAGDPARPGAQTARAAVRGRTDHVSRSPPYAGPDSSFVHRRILRRHARRSSGVPLKISRVTGPAYPRAFSALTSRSTSIPPCPNGRCSSPVSPWPPWLSWMWASANRSPSASRYVRPPSVRRSRWACPTSRQYRSSGIASSAFRRTSGGSSTFSRVTATPRSVAAFTRSANHDVFASGEVLGAERASMKCALKIRVPIGARASMKPTNRARSAWLNREGGRCAVSNGIFSARSSASSCRAAGSSDSHVRSNSA